MDEPRYAYRKLANDCHVVIDLWDNQIYGKAHFTEDEAIGTRDYMNENWLRDEAAFRKHWIRFGRKK